MAFTGTILTTKGLALQTKVQAGAQLSFTKVKIGDGQLGSGQSMEALTDLIAPKKTLDISAVAVIGDGTSRVRAVVTNTGLAAGFFVREIGLFATDPDDGEILYCVANAGNECDYLPTPTSVAVEQTIDILTAIGNATNVTAVINETIVLATIQDITDHNNNPDAHNLRRWKASRDYVVGDICFSKLLATDSYKYFECIVAGTSGTIEPTWPAPGGTVTDGGVTWIVRDLRVATATSDDSTKIATSQWVKDVALPLAGGNMTGPINEALGAGIASAATTDIGAATGNLVEVTGTTTITGLGIAQAGARRVVRFVGILTLTHNAASLILPGAANITTVPGDTATFISLGGGNWVCVDYQSALIQPVSRGGTGGTTPAAARANLVAMPVPVVGGDIVVSHFGAGAQQVTPPGGTWLWVSLCVLTNATGAVNITTTNWGAQVYPGNTNIDYVNSGIYRVFLFWRVS